MALKQIKKESRQDDLVAGVGKNIMARAQDVNPTILEVNRLTELLNLVAKDFINDAAASAGGVAVGELYHTSGALKIRLV